MKAFINFLNWFKKTVVKTAVNSIIGCSTQQQKEFHYWKSTVDITVHSLLEIQLKHNFEIGIQNYIKAIQNLSN